MLVIRYSSIGIRQFLQLSKEREREKYLITSRVWRWVFVVAFEEGRKKEKDSLHLSASIKFALLAFWLWPTFAVGEKETQRDHEGTQRHTSTEGRGRGRGLERDTWSGCVMTVNKDDCQKERERQADEREWSFYTSGLFVDRKCAGRTSSVMLQEKGWRKKGRKRKRGCLPVCLGFRWFLSIRCLVDAKGSMKREREKAKTKVTYSPHALSIGCACQEKPDHQGSSQREREKRLNYRHREWTFSRYYSE